jgi:hypothetical protein
VKWDITQVNRIANQLSQEIPTFYGTWSFITVFTIAYHWTLPWVRWINTHPHILFNIILSMPRPSTLCRPSRFFNQNSPFCLQKINKKIVWLKRVLRMKVFFKKWTMRLKVFK